MEKDLNRRSSTLFFLMIICTGGLLAQESLAASGGDASGDGGSVAYSIGQVAYSTNNAITGTVSQGVQHPYEIITVGIKETELNISLLIFPNPTADNLTLQVEDYNNERLSFQLLDIQGKLLGSDAITTSNTQINLSDLSAGTYLINIIQENRNAQSFIIIKS